MSVNLALAMGRKGLRVGILDTDIFGPSIPTLLNLSGEPRLSAGKLLLRPASLMIRQSVDTTGKLWHQGHVDGVSRQGERPGGLARPDDHEGITATASRS